ncbi:hypothetical protein C1X65_21800 [Pseudomonas sp. FW305-70]|nr:hypothetical protein C1X65_21800 [Pseudomonas sp. FW305-70]
MCLRCACKPKADNTSPSVGASLLAMVVNDDAGNLMPRGALRFIASELAPTGNCVAYEKPGVHL